MHGRVAVTGVQRLLAVLALVAGVLAMHSLAVGHGPSPAGATAMSTSTTAAMSAMSTSTTAAMSAPTSHREPAPIPARHAGDPAGDGCLTDCGGGMDQVGWMCLAVLAGATAALLSLLARRSRRSDTAPDRGVWGPALSLSRWALCRPPPPRPSYGL